MKTIINISCSLLVASVYLTGCSEKNETNDNTESTTVEHRLYQGKNNGEGYYCYLKTFAKDSVLFVYEREDFSVYGEHRGTINAINDTTFHISATLTFGHYICKGVPDSLVLFNSTPGLINFSEIIVQYENDEIFREKVLGNDNVTFGYNPELFHHNHPAKILLNKIHPISNKPIEITTYPGSASDFASGDELEFDVIIIGNRLKTTGNVLQTGSFTLTAN